MSVSADIIHLSNKMDLNDAVIFVYPFIWQVDDIKKRSKCLEIIFLNLIIH